MADDYEGNTGQTGEPEPFDAAWHEAVAATLEEWHSPEDDGAFRDLLGAG